MYLSGSRSPQGVFSGETQQEHMAYQACPLPWVKGFYIEGEVELLLLKRGVAVTSLHWGLLGGRAPRPLAGPGWRGAAHGAAVAGGSCAQRRQTSKSKDCFVPGSHRHNWLHRVQSDRETGPGGGGGLWQWDEGQKEDSKLQRSPAGCIASASAEWGHTSRHVISVPKHNTGNLSLVSQQTVLMRDSRKKPPVVLPASFSLGIVFGVKTAWKNTWGYLEKSKY